MTKVKILPESHRSDRINWLRAAVLGANDGIVSSASLMIGVAAANSSHSAIFVSGVAGLVAGAMSMAAGEYVSVSSQSDIEQADLARERDELESNIEFEHEELAQIYQERGLTPELSMEVAKQLMAHDALGSHAREELGITSTLRARPLQMALTSAASFSIGASLPLITALISPFPQLIPSISISALLFLLALGALAAKAGGASFWKGALRVGFWGALAMATTALIGKLFGHFF